MAAEHRWTATRVFLVALALGCLTARGLTHGDAALHVATADAIVGRGTDALELDVGELWVPTARVAGGLLYDDGRGLRMAASPGLAWLAVPGVALARAVEGRPIGDALSPLFTGRPPRVAIRRAQADARVIAFALLAPLFAALACAFVYRGAVALELPPRARWLATLAFALGSPMLAFAGSDWTQLPVTAAVAYATSELAARDRRGRGPVAPIGIALGLAALVRPDALALAPLFVAALYGIDRSWRRSPSRGLLRILAPLALAVAALAAVGLPASGGGWRLDELPRGALGLLLSPQTGLLVYAPFVALAPLGARREPLAPALVGPPLVLLVIYGGWFDWPASLAYGPRFLLPALPALALLFGRATARRPDLALAGAGLVAIGFAVELPGALLAHVRLPEGGPLAPAFVAAYRAWADDPAVGALGVDCASTYAPAFAYASLLAAALGLAGEAWHLRRRLGP